MNEDNQYIPGIYNYCDYDCDHCAFTSQCFLKAHEKEFLEEAEQRKESGEEEWEELEFHEEERWLGDSSWEDQDDDEETLFKERDEEKVKEIVKPAREIFKIGHSILKSLGGKKHLPGSIQDALDKVGWNHALIEVKYRRALYGLPEKEDEEIDELVYWGLMDSENTFLAMQGFLWNMRMACTHIGNHLKEYKKQTKRIIELCNIIQKRIDNEYLPLVRNIIRRNRDRFEGDDIE
jgi:hypothetical protein